MMKPDTPKRMFTAEVQRRKRLGQDEVSSPTPGSAIPVDDEVRQEIRDIKDELRFLGHMLRAYLEPDTVMPMPDGVPPITNGDPSPIMGAYERQRDEMRVLRTELKALANSIQETKKEIASLRSKDADDDKLTVVASELDAVVGATESATNGILEAAEKIDGLAQNLRSHANDAYSTQIAEEIVEGVLTIFEHCNFQDITGQRITKVVNTLKFIETRVEKMMDIWGRESFEDIESEKHDELEDEDAKLLNGPALEHLAISQDEIDRLFD